MSAKERKPEVFSYLKKVKCEYLARSLFWTRTKKPIFQQNYSFFEQRSFKHLCICVNANVCVFERTHESRLCVLHSLHGLPGQRC